jgi:hypothetical protein
VSWSASAGRLSGTPTAAGTFTSSYQAELSDGEIISDIALSIIISPASNPAPTYTYTLKFNANGGSGAPADRTETTANAPPYSMAVPSQEPAMAGYVFMGWASSAGAQNAAYSPGGYVMFDTVGVRTLYAVWRLPTYEFRIHYDPNGGTGAPPDTVSSGNADPRYDMPLSASVPSWAGHNFVGWALTPNGQDGSGGSTLVSGNSYRFDAPATVAVTVYAQWLSAAPGDAQLWFVGEAFEYSVKTGEAFEKTFPTNIPAEVTADSLHGWLQLDGGRLFGTAPDSAKTYEVTLHATAGTRHCEQVVEITVEGGGDGGAAAGNAALILILIGAMFCAVAFWPKKRGRR